MKIDALKQYAKLHQQLIEEKSQIENRLVEINQVLGPQTTLPSTSGPAQAVAAPKSRRGRPPKGSLSIKEIVTKALTERGPLSRKELGQAVIDLGYQTKSKNVLGSIGNVLYAKDSPFKSSDGKFHLAGGTAVKTATVGNETKEAPTGKKKRKMSAEAKAKISLAAKARWAKVKKKK